MKRKKDITTYFCTNKTKNNEADIETEPDDGVERALQFFQFAVLVPGQAVEYNERMYWIQ